MSKKNKNKKNRDAMENKEINEQELQEENIDEAQMTQESEAEEKQPEEQEAKEAGSEAQEAEPEAQAAQGTPEEKKVKKERKIKWAKGASEEAENAAKAFEDKIREANDKYTRLFAEFDNFRKRSEKEKAQRYDFGAKDMVEKILPVIDNFERGLSAVPEEQKEDSFVKGMEMTYKLLLKALEDAGVKPIEAVGQEFDPEFHNAVMHVDDPEVGTNIVVEEFQKGYMYKDQVVRYSMVKVAN